MVGSVGSGRIALPASARILPGVSFPSRVVRSIIRMAMSRAHSFDSRLIERLASMAARSSMPTWSTGHTRPSRLPSAWWRGAESAVRRRVAGLVDDRVAVMRPGGS